MSQYTVAKLQNVWSTRNTLAPTPPSVLLQYTDVEVTQRFLAEKARPGYWQRTTTLNRSLKLSNIKRGADGMSKVLFQLR